GGRVRRQFDAQREGVAVDGGLGRVVEREGRGGEGGGERGHEHDVATSTFDHVGREVAGQQDGCAQVDVEESVDLCGCEGCDFTGTGQGGGRDEHVGVAALGGEPRGVCGGRGVGDNDVGLEFVAEDG